MASVFTWCEDNGAGRTPTVGITDASPKSIDDTTTPFYDAPISAPGVSFDKWIYGKITGTYTSISAGLCDRVSGYMPAGVTLMGAPSMTVDADRLTYATPAQATNAALTRSYTPLNNVFPTGAATVFFGPTGPNSSGKAASSSANPCYTNYLTIQATADSTASPGSMAPVTLLLQYTEN